MQNYKICDKLDQEITYYRLQLLKKQEKMANHKRLINLLDPFEIPILQQEITELIASINHIIEIKNTYGKLTQLKAF